MRKEIRLRGINMVYDDLGKGEVILLIHGQPFNRSMWDDQKEILFPNYRLIIPDLRGYGESGLSEGMILLDELALDLLHLLDHLEIQKTIVISLSMGGQIALEMFNWGPGIFKALILADTDARAEDEKGYQNRLALSKSIAAGGMGKFTNERIGHFMCENTFTHKPEVIARVEKMMKSTPAAGASAVQRGRAERRDYTPLLGKINFPVLIVVGDRDEFTPLASAEYMHQRIRRSALAVIPDSGHISNMEQPEAFNQVLLKFLNHLKG
jgi:3-oxoadipate enol-lactonase